MPRERWHEWPGDRAGQLHGLEDRLGVAELPRAGPESGRRQPGDGGGPACRAGQQRERATQGVAGHMRAVQPEFVEEREDFFGYGADHRAAIGHAAQRRRCAVTGQVDRDDGAMRRQQAQDRVPGLPPVPYPVQQHHRRPGSMALVGQAHRDLLLSGNNSTLAAANRGSGGKRKGREEGKRGGARRNRARSGPEAPGRSRRSRARSGLDAFAVGYGSGLGAAGGA
jgi:hypothetical protein